MKENYGYGTSGGDVLNGLDGDNVKRLARIGASHLANKLIRELFRVRFYGDIFRKVKEEGYGDGPEDPGMDFFESVYCYRHARNCARRFGLDVSTYDKEMVDYLETVGEDSMPITGDGVFFLAGRDFVEEGVRLEKN